MSLPIPPELLALPAAPSPRADAVLAYWYPAGPKRERLDVALDALRRTPAAGPLGHARRDLCDALQRGEVLSGLHRDAGTALDVFNGLPVVATDRGAVRALLEALALDLEAEDRRRAERAIAERTLS